MASYRQPWKSFCPGGTLQRSTNLAAPLPRSSTPSPTEEILRAPRWRLRGRRTCMRFVSPEESQNTEMDACTFYESLLHLRLVMKLCIFIARQAVRHAHYRGRPVLFPPVWQGTKRVHSLQQRNPSLNVLHSLVVSFILLRFKQSVIC